MSNVDEIDDYLLCEKCVASPFDDWIEMRGGPGKCDFEKLHGPSKTVVPVQVFAEEVDRYFRDNYQRGADFFYATPDSDSPSHDTYGESYKDILANDLGCNEELLDAIIERLPDYDHADIADGAEAFYDDCANYESIEAARKRDDAEAKEYWYEHRFSYQWEEFCEIVQNRRRFFQIKEPLDELFGKPEEYAEGNIRPVYELPTGVRIYRARLLDSDFTETRLQENVARGLSAPPRIKASGGRMNVEYIPAFYGAFSEGTAIAEVRPSIGDRVVVGEFVLQQGLKVFDFTAFSKIEADKWNEASQHTRFEFIRQMESEISKPILPFEKQREYIPTQIVAEYLREYFGCDAVIYHSSMRKSAQDDTRNIVIFHRGVEFVGNGAILALANHNISAVADVVYTTFKDMF
jgi:hypothetical protein